MPSNLEMRVQRLSEDIYFERCRSHNLPQADETLSDGAIPIRSSPALPKT